MGPGDDMVSIAAENLLSCLQRDPECFQAWAVSHKKQIKGSCRILQHLLHVSPKNFLDLLKSPTNKEAFKATMKKLQDRHGFLLAQDRGWQAACAKGAHEATKKFLDGSVVSRSSSGRISTRVFFAACILTGVVSAVVLSKWDDVEDLLVDFQNSEAGRKVEEFVKSEAMQGIKENVESLLTMVGEFAEDMKVKVMGMIG